MQSTQLLNYLKSTGAIMEGHFLLTSGLHSNVYIEKFRILEDPNALDLVCKEMSKIVKNKEIKLVLGAAIGGILISGGVGRYLGVKHIFSERVDGEMELRRGFSINLNQKVLIVEDIITTGGSVIELVKLAESYGADVIHIVSLVDRSSNPIDFGVSFSPLLSIPSESWEKQNCPLCLKGVALIERGRSGK